jgi:hypothetical protein
MSWSDIRHHYMDYEEPEPTKQPRCPKCKRFLPFAPNDKVQKTQPNGHWDYETDVWVVDGPDFVFDLEPLWICSCGGIWESSDIEEFK